MIKRNESDTTAALIRRHVWQLLNSMGYPT